MGHLLERGRLLRTMQYLPPPFVEIVNSHVAVLPDGSAKRYTTGSVIPAPIKMLGLGYVENSKVAVPELSVAVGAVHVTWAYPEGTD